MAFVIGEAGTEEKSSYRISEFVNMPIPYGLYKLLFYHALLFRSVLSYIQQ